MSNEWDSFVEASDGHILQTSRWGRLKSAFGWQSQIVPLERDAAIRAGALVLFRRLPLGLGSIAYVPRGPVLNWQNQDDVSALLTELDAACAEEHAILMKWEPDLPDSPANRRQLVTLDFQPSIQVVQPPRSLLIDVQASDEEILARMNQGTRRKVRQSARHEVQIRQGTSADLDSFNALMSATGDRHDFGVHSPAYYRQAFDLFHPDYAVLLMASYAGRDLGGLMVFALGSTSWYFYGASSAEERHRMPTYGLQWEAIQWARARGCAAYDLWGVPDYDHETLEAQFQRRSDGLWGVYGFKRGFGGRLTRTVGTWDRIYRPLPYYLYRLVIASREAIAP